MRRCGTMGALVAAVAAVACHPTDTGGPPNTGWIADKLRAIYGDTPGEVRYLHGAADLNGDGNPEVLVYLMGPMLCGTGGCNTLVFTPGDSGFDLVADISLTRPPIRVSAQRSRGWRNLLVQVSGGGIIPGYESELRFDGETYPANPTVPPAAAASDSVDGVEVIPEFDDFSDGTLLSSAGDTAEGLSTGARPLGRWEWVSFQGMDDTFLEVGDPSRYTLEIRADGVSLLADCNRGTAGVEIDRSSMRLTAIATTQMACPPGSLEDRYLSYLEYVRGWVMDGGELFLSLMADGGILRFRAEGA